MAWRIEVSAAAEQDVALIFDVLTESYIGFGDAPVSAAEHASDRIGKILDAMERIATAPYRGTAHEAWLPGLRHLTLERAIYWYQLDATLETIRVLAIFYGGQDHTRQMLLRLLREQPQ
jgi:plasmid stabilization system protein ParE